MIAIKILLVIILAILALLTLLLIRRQLTIRLLFLLHAAIGVLFVLWPDLTTKLAHAVGVGRGTDLMLYLLIMFVAFASLCILAKFRQIERRQTLIIRQLALQNPVIPTIKES